MVYGYFSFIFNLSHFLKGAFEVCVCDKNASTLPQVLNGQYMKNRYIEVFHHVEVETSKSLEVSSLFYPGFTISYYDSVCLIDLCGPPFNP